MRIFSTWLALILVIVCAAGCGSDTNGANCDALKTDATKCLNDYCANNGSGTVPCDCWAQGKDTNQNNCECVDMNWGALCDSVDLDAYQPGSLNCAAMEGALAGICN